mgnify:CR=1 FL=1
MKLLNKTKTWGGSKGLFPLNVGDKSFWIFMAKRIFKNTPNVKRYAGRKLYTANEGNAILHRMISSGKPFAAGKIGDVELYIAQTYEKKKLNQFDMYRLFNNAGFFPDDEQLMKRFGKEYCKALAGLDLVGCWFNRQEDALLKRYGSESLILSTIRSLEPYYFEKPWSKALEGKKVLVINPFDSTISNQYRNHRKELFEDKSVLPEFELKVYKSVQTIGDCVDTRYSTWFEALNAMAEDISKIDFDIALVGCGAYGIPLCVKIKEMGKQAIHMGGATQILFGIKGKRWMNHAIISGLFNDYWCFPSGEEQPQTTKGPKAYW